MKEPIPTPAPATENATDASNLLHKLLHNPVSQHQTPALSSLDVEVDGRQVTVRAEHELVLRCGEAAIVLHADGRIELRGTYITSQASATNRIRGGSIDLN